jgi:hypothetical protein
VKHATFTNDGAVNAPTGYHSWVFVGAPLKPTTHAMKRMRVMTLFSLNSTQCYVLPKNKMARDLCTTLILAKIWKLTIDFIVKNMMKLANMELCRGLG